MSRHASAYPANEESTSETQHRIGWFFALPERIINPEVLAARDPVRSNMFSYTVRCRITDPKVAQSWLDWLMGEHIQDVVDAGATSAEIFQMDHNTYEIRYCFASAESFDDYERNHAPRLRAEGLEKFPLDLGLEYSRSTGHSLHRHNC